MNESTMLHTEVVSLLEKELDTVHHEVRRGKRRRYLRNGQLEDLTGLVFLRLTERLSQDEALFRNVEQHPQKHLRTLIDNILRSEARSHRRNDARWDCSEGVLDRLRDTEGNVGANRYDNLQQESELGNRVREAVENPVHRLLLLLHLCPLNVKSGDVEAAVDGSGAQGSNKTHKQVGVSREVKELKPMLEDWCADRLQGPSGASGLPSAEERVELAWILREAEGSSLSEWCPSARAKAVNWMDKSLSRTRRYFA